MLDKCSYGASVDIQVMTGNIVQEKGTASLSAVHELSAIQPSLMQIQ
jgi:hypothetical protein